MKIQKYKAKVIHSGQTVIGYIAETRKYLGSGCYSHTGTSYVISVTEKSMPDNGSLYGTHLVDENTIEEI
jgi:hypothetical protein